MGSPFSDAHAAMSAGVQLLVSQAFKYCGSSILLWRPSTKPVLVDGRVLRLGNCATAAAQGAVVGDIVRISRDAQTEEARRGWAHERAQEPQNWSGIGNVGKCGTVLWRDVSWGVTWSAGLFETAHTERWVVVHAGKCFQYCSTQEADLAMRSGAS